MGNLTTLDAVKAYGSIAGLEMDPLLEKLITRASASVENYLQRSVGVADYTETRNGTGSFGMLLAAYPVVAVTSLSVNGAAIPAAPAFGQAGWWLAERTLLLTGYTFTRGLGNVLVSYRAGFAVTPPDIEQACIESVLLALKRRDHLDVSSKSLAGETVSFITSDLTPSARQVLNSYRRVAPL